MNISVIDHGIWERYTPDVFPEHAPSNAMFARRVSDGLDWYEFAHNPASWMPGSLRACALIGADYELMQAITYDESTLFPANSRLIEIIGYDPEDPKPWKAFEQKILDIGRGAFSDRPEPPVLSVSAAQAKTALYNAGLLTYVKQIVADHPYEPVKIFFESANVWIKDSPYLQAIAAELNLSPAALDKLFEDAAKL